ncbi:unnamed protein product [Fraxinus pennsylvanica]|uniref:Uncharacterized protein n=1 Tax=Fraxinus pennsylvanica TaxID=56036 RepID=A0AAD1ZQH8_9LAMI|nr:unnamed protein product [Fraxinus pennsylvanica]
MGLKIQVPLLPLLEKGILQKHQPEAKFSSPTPVKTKEPSRIKCREEVPELPEWYTALSEFFDHLICSLRRFSQKTVAAEKEKTCLLSLIKSSCVANQETEGTRTFPNSSSKSAATIQVTQTSHCLSSATSGNTPMKLASAEGDNLVVETSAQSTPMRSVSPNRSVLTCEDECKTATSQNSTTGNLTH